MLEEMRQSQEMEGSGSPELKEVSCVLNSNFGIQEQIETMLKDDISFLVKPEQIEEKILSECLKDGDRGDLLKEENYDANQEVYVHTREISLNEAGKTLYIYLHFSKDREYEQWKAFHQNLTLCKEELEAGKRNPAHEDDYKEFFLKKPENEHDSDKSEPGPYRYAFNQKAVNAACRHFGWFALISSYPVNGKTALQQYRLKDLMCSRFHDIDAVFNTRYLQDISFISQDAKVFLEFLALILQCGIEAKMNAQGLFSKMSLSKLFQMLDSIKLYESRSKELSLSRISSGCKELYEKLGIPVPSIRRIMQSQHQ